MTPLSWAGVKASPSVVGKGTVVIGSFLTRIRAFFCARFIASISSCSAWRSDRCDQARFRAAETKDCNVSTIAPSDNGPVSDAYSEPKSLSDGVGSYRHRISLDQSPSFPTVPSYCRLFPLARSRTLRGGVVASMVVRRGNGGNAYRSNALARCLLRGRARCFFVHARVCGSERVNRIE